MSVLMVFTVVAFLSAAACVLVLSVTNNHGHSRKTASDEEIEELALNVDVDVANLRSKPLGVPLPDKYENIDSIHLIESFSRRVSSNAKSTHHTRQLRVDESKNSEAAQTAIEGRARIASSVQINIQTEMRRWRRQYRKFRRITSNKRYQYRLVNYDDGYSDDLNLPGIVEVDTRQKSKTPPSYPSIEDIFLSVKDIIKSGYTYTSYVVRYNRPMGYIRSIDIVVVGSEDGAAIPLLRVRLGKFVLKDDDPINGNAIQQNCQALRYSSHNGYFTQYLQRNGRPRRQFKIYTPPSYNKLMPAPIVVMLHGWSIDGCSGGDEFIRDNNEWRRYADSNGYVVVAPEGLSEGSEYPASWAVPGSRDGRGKDGRTITSCDNSLYEPDHCFPSCNGCGGTRCGWTQCLDDDVEFIVDLIQELPNYLCVDQRRIYFFGYSNGGMMAWTLGQDRRSASLLAGIASAQGLPMWDYLQGKGTNGKLPAIGIYGEYDESVPPGDGTRQFNEVLDSDGYYYVDAFWQHRVWAQNHACRVSGSAPARYTYDIRGRREITCRTHCSPGDGPPPSLDCRAPFDSHGKESWHLDAALKFFTEHARADGLI